jgi:cation:H+ antiporter
VTRASGLRKALGPGVLFTGAAVGVSHLVQSTRAGAVYGFALLLIVVLANVAKYPAFRFGPQYAAATNRSLLEGYRRQGRWALLVYAALTVGTMFTVEAAVTLVTAGLAKHLFGLELSPLVVSAALIAVCGGILAAGKYHWLDRISKVVVSVLAVSTVAATAIALPAIDFGAVSFWPERWDAPTVFFVVALMGWMPSAIDVAVWQSLWTLAREKDTAHRPTMRESMFDFHLGYWGTAFLAVCFVLLGAGTIFGRGIDLSDTAGGFAAQVVDLYAATLGEWSRPIIAVSAFATMFSTTLTVVDGFPRALAVLVARRRRGAARPRQRVLGERDPPRRGLTDHHLAPAHVALCDGGPRDDALAPHGPDPRVAQPPSGARSRGAARNATAALARRGELARHRGPRRVRVVLPAREARRPGVDRSAETALELLLPAFAIVAGFVALVWGADRFVDGASGLAASLGVSPLVIGLTIVGFGTSAPEMLVSAIAAATGAEGIAVGNAIGSNITNSGLVLGVTALVAPLTVHSTIIRRELPLLVGIMLMSWALVSDDDLSRTDGAILLSGFVLLVGFMVAQGLREVRGGEEPLAAEFARELPKRRSIGVSLLWTVLGLTVLLVSARLVVWGGSRVAEHFGVSELVIGLTVVAIGTSLPELAASVVAATKNEHDIAIGNVVGSNMFNLLAVLALPGLIAPGPVDAAVATRDFPVMVGLTVLLLALARGFRVRSVVTRLSGGILVTAFCGYLVLLLL